LRCLADEIKKGWPRQPVVYETPIPARQYHACLAQCHQVLGEVRLPPAEGGFQVADARLDFADSQQDLQPGRLADGLQEECYFFNGRYIRRHEYIIFPEGNLD
jgi:hypothetical protein